MTIHPFLNPRLIMCRGFSIFAVTALYASSPCSASLVRDEVVHKVATTWAARCALMTDTQCIAATTSVADTFGQPLFHIVEFAPIGFVVVSADSEVEPVIAYSGDSKIAWSDEASLLPLLRHDVGERMAALQSHAAQSLSASQKARASGIRARWNDLLGTTPGPSATGISSVSDVCVAPMLKTKWSQSNVWSNGQNLAVYNYYTPPFAEGDTRNYYTGCTATAKAQILRFHQWTKSVDSTKTHGINVDGSGRNVKMRGGDGNGGPYDWANMPDVPSSVSLTLTQRKAIGALLYDAGITNYMSYTPTGSGGNTTAASLLNDFQFGSAQYWSTSDSLGVQDALNTNLAAGLPTILAIWNSSVGHEVVCDGYAYNGSAAYYHLNMGWGGSSDAWYNLPTVDDGYYNFTSIGSGMMNMDVSDCGTIIGGRVTDANGHPIAGAIVSINSPSRTTTSSDRGVFAFKGNAIKTTYTLTATAAGYKFRAQTATTGNRGFYAVGNATANITGTQTATIDPNARLSNISTRSWVGADSDVLIAGFVIPGNHPKQVLIRASGPALIPLGVSGTLADPRMELHDAVNGNVILGTNDDWSAEAATADVIAATAAKLGAFAWTRGSKDAAMLVNLPPGVYSVVVSGANKGTGIAIIEVYDVDADTNPTRLANISSRSQAKTGDQAQFAGFVVSGHGPKRILVRASGPALAPLGVTNVLPNPTLELHDASNGNVIINTNDDWSADAAEAADIEAVAKSIGAYEWQRGTKDTALLVTLNPGVYSVVVKDASGLTGNALIEVYEAP